MSTEITPTEPKRYQCRHIHADGRQCGSRALRGELFCYYHHTTRPPKKVSSFGAAGGPAFALERDTLSTFDLPLPDDRASIQACIGLILQRIAHGQLDSKRAGLLLYGLQIASLNLPKPTAAQSTEPIEEFILDPTHGPIAPETELQPPAREKSLYDFMMEQWELEKAKPLTIQAVAEESPHHPAGHPERSSSRTGRAESKNLPRRPLTPGARTSSHRPILTTHPTLTTVR